MDIDPIMNKVLILDPSCVADSRTHNMNSVLGHARTFISAGYDVITGTNIKCNIDRKHIKNCPVFIYTIYDDHRKKRTGVYKRLLFMFYYRHLVRKTTKAIKLLIQNNDIGKHDHIFIPTTDWILFKSLLNIYSKKTNRPYLHLLLMYEKGRWMTGGYPYKRIINNLKYFGELQKDIFIYTETEQHAKNLSKSIGFIPPKYPFPSFPVTTGGKGLPTDKYTYIGVMGGGRKDKGFALLPMIISKFNQRYNNHESTRFIIQKPRIEDRLDSELHKLEQISNVLLLDNFLPWDKYCQYLVQCDIAIFPYSNVYFSRGSGLVNEAVAYNIPIICSENTALTEAITHNNGKSARSVDEFADALIEIIENMNTYKDNAAMAKSEYLNKLHNNPVIVNIKKLSC